MNSRKLFHYGSWAMFVTGIIHLIGHFTHPDLSTDEKKEMYRMMNELQFEMDPWFTRSVYDIFDAFSLFLTVMLLTLGLSNIVVYRSNASDVLIKQKAGIQSIGMIAMLFLSVVYAFSVPITLFAIVTLLMVLAYVKG